MSNDDSCPRCLDGVLHENCDCNNSYLCIKDFSHCIKCNWYFKTSELSSMRKNPELFMGLCDGRGIEAAKKAELNMIDHPPHYNSSSSKCECGRRIECIDVTRHMNFNTGNAMKYLWRFEHKNGLEDLKKAAWYLNDEIKKREKNV